MNTKVKQALDTFNTETTKSEKAERALSTLISCFGDSCVDVTRCNPITIDERFDSSIDRLIQRDAPVEEFLNHIRWYHPFWQVIIKFPHETITNEIGNRVDIYDFFVKILIKYDGSFHGINANKATYTEDQLYSGYVHSHCPSLSRTVDGVREWRSMCFGSGPINNTMYSLRNRDHDDRLWIAFAAELRQWVRTESTDGGPYFRMSSISNKYKEVEYEVPARPAPRMREQVLPLIKSYIRADRLKIGFASGKYCLGTSFTEWLADFSEYARAWASKNNVPLNFVDTLVINNKICKVEHPSSTRDEYRNLVGVTVLKFKGEDIKLKVVQGEKVEHLSLIDYRFGLYIVKTLLDTINYNYGRTDTTNTAIPVQWK